MEILLIHKGRV